MPNFYILALTVPEILGGVSKFQKYVTRDPHMTPFDLILFFSSVLTAIHLCAKFEHSSFNHSGDIRGVPKFQKWVVWPPRDPFWPNFADFGYFLPFSICLSNLRWIDSSMTDIWLFYDFADLAAKCLFGPILGSFGGFWPLKSLNCYFDLQKDALPAETRVMRYCALKSVQRSHL